MEWGSKLESLLAFQAESGITPKALQELPPVPKHLRWYYDCFRELTRDRRFDQGQPLPLTTFEIRTYWSAFKLTDFEEFYEAMHLFDMAWLHEVAKKQELEAQKAKAKEKPSLKPARRG